MGVLRVLGKWREEALRGPGIWVSEEAVYVPGLSASSCPHSLKVEYDKLANEKTEMQRHYVMVRGSPQQGGGRAGQGTQAMGSAGTVAGLSLAQLQDRPLEGSLH